MSDMTTDPVDLPTPVANWLNEYKRIQAEIKELQERLDIARAHVELALGESTLGLVNGNPAIKWGFVEQRRFDQTKAKELLRDQPGLLESCYTTQRMRRFEIVKDEA